MNSCNPVFIDVGQRLGVDRYYKYFTQFGLKGKQGSIFRERQPRSCIKGENGCCGISYRILRTVLSDHTHSAYYDSGFHCKRRTPGYASFWRKGDPLRMEVL